MSRRKFITGALLLFISTFVVKLIGALYRIPLTDILGGEGMGYYSTAFNIFAPLFALFVTGLPIAVSHHVAAAVAIGDEARAKTVVRTALIISLVAGTLGTGLLVASAQLFSSLVHNEAAAPAIYCLAPTLFFSAISAVLRGATQGRQNMAPTAISQLVEVVIKLFVGIGFAIIAADYLLEKFHETGYIFSTVYPTMMEAGVAIIPYAAAASLAGISLSNLIGTALLMVISRKTYMGGSVFRRDIAHDILSMAFPVALSAVVINLTSLIDLATIMRHIEALMIEKPDELFAAYPGLGLELKGDELANFLYGSYTGVAMSVFHLVPSLTVALGISIIPLVTGYKRRGNKEGVQNAVETALRFTALLAAPAGFGISALAGPILSLLYPTRVQEVEIATPMLVILGYAAVFVAILIPMNTVLQALGRPDLPVKLMLASATLKLILNLILVPMPQYNIRGAAFATLGCYALLFVLTSLVLRYSCGLKIPIADIFMRAIGAAGVVGLVAYFTFEFLHDLLSLPVSLAIAMGVALVLYVIIAPFFGILRKKDALLLPFAKKMRKPLDFIDKMR